MRLQELFETTEEDRALTSLSSAIYAQLRQYLRRSRNIHAKGRVLPGRKVIYPK